ncbi:MAG: class I SAM-dependent methyltransferase [Bacteroidota bacterium]|nr:class I SAM-dependent methyltransferase [Bacteroidota bacterium]MDP4231052.1 class I SAM-dependent methyltransferase [Bacteroidota bacterium]MDP4234858.1 class I SAM-dependent methyltransferase [Bacteroidota bacterium]
MAKFPPRTEEKVNILAKREDINSYDRYYFGYQYGLGTEYIAPYLKSKGVPLSGARICEIGCGESGVLAALAEEGAAEVVGIDLRDLAIESSKKIFDAIGINGEFAIHNIITQPPPEKWRAHFDIVLLRDVIEHLEETELSLRHVMDFMKPGGWLYVVFPPYYSPFGAHQHLLDNTVSKFPYIQLLPEPLFKQAYKNARLQIDVEEVSMLRRIRLTISKMRRAIKNALLELVDEELYFIRPVFKLKFGLPPIKANLLKYIPGLRELAALEASYLLRKKQ